MTEKKPLILQIQEDCLDRSIYVSQILRKAKVAATKLELEDFLKWIDDELNGYMCTAKELPLYRFLTGAPKGYNPYHGWQSIIFKNPDMAKIVSGAPINQAIGPMEEMLLHKPEGQTFIFPYDPEIKTKISSMLQYPADVHLEVSEGAIAGIVDRVRNILLDWALGLERSGVLGGEMSFDSKEKKEATTVTQHIHAEIVNVTGQVSDQASVTQIQENYRSSVNIHAVVDFANQAQGVINQLPEKIVNDADKYMSYLVEETSKKEPDHSRIRSLLTSLKTVCEGAVGNLTAQGIVGMIGNLL